MHLLFVRIVHLVYLGGCVRGDEKVHHPGQSQDLRQAGARQVIHHNWLAQFWQNFFLNLPSKYR